jgi:hypothetical protein
MSFTVPNSLGGRVKTSCGLGGRQPRCSGVVRLAAVGFRKQSKRSVLDGTVQKSLVSRYGAGSKGDCILKDPA